MKKGDIVICCREIEHTSNQLTIGDKYEIINNPIFNDMYYPELDVKNINTGKIHGWVESNHFIPLDVWREMQLIEILQDEKG